MADNRCEIAYPEAMNAAMKASDEINKQLSTSFSEALQNATAPVKQKNRIRQITITQLNNGFVVKVGCGEFAFTDATQMLSKLIDYVNDPSGVEKKWDETGLI